MEDSRSPPMRSPNSVWSRARSSSSARTAFSSTPLSASAGSMTRKSLPCPRRSCRNGSPCRARGRTEGSDEQHLGGMHRHPPRVSWFGDVLLERIAEHPRDEPFVAAAEIGSRRDVHPPAATVRFHGMVPEPRNSCETGQCEIEVPVPPAIRASSPSWQCTLWARIVRGPRRLLPPRPGNPEGTCRRRCPGTNRPGRPPWWCRSRPCPDGCSR